QQTILAQKICFLTFIGFEIFNFLSKKLPLLGRQLLPLLCYASGLYRCMQAFSVTHSNTLIKILTDDSELMKRILRNRLFAGSLSSGLLV
ncbi:hypothetical protein C0J52_08618, partial [Blattella germanica]